MSARLPGWSPLFSGKVRDVHVSESDPGLLLLVASDRVSAYDHVLPTSVPGKGAVLTEMTRWWCEQLADVVPNHLVAPGTPGVPPVPAGIAERAAVARRLDMLPVECVARGYLAGSAWREYRESGAVTGVRLPAGLVEAARLPEPIFTPATKAPAGEHDENISFDELVARVGGGLAQRLRDLTLAVYRRGAGTAERAGLLLADTKLEFGVVPDGAGELVLADEVLTPDSSRFWDAAGWAPGRPPPMFDKQIVRDWLTGPESGWSPGSGQPPPPLPDAVTARTAARYREVSGRLRTAA
ncbi:MAG: phosphoribosylaminoimidazolesuccinocarboxamide synthase [Kineosporiaceae bacterium]